MDCEKAIPLMHDFVDGDLDKDHAAQLHEHIAVCNQCRIHLHQLEKTDAFIRVMPTIQAPEGLTSKIMEALPKQKKHKAWFKWVKTHPAISVATIFLMVMMSSFLSLWNQETDLMVRGSDLENVVIKGNTVVVPAGRTVNGDLVVENGQIEVGGEVKGNLVIIDGKVNLASTAHISGEIKQINQALDWFWYKVMHTYSVLAH